MADVIFTGQFLLSDALADFQKFAAEVQSTLNKINENATKQSKSKAQARVEELLGISEDSLRKAEQNLNNFKSRVQKAVEQGIIDPKQARSFTDALDAKFAALEKRIARLNIKQEEEIKFTQSEIVSTRQLIDEIEKLTEKQNKAFGNASYAQDVKAREQAARDSQRITDQQLAYNIKSARQETEERRNELARQRKAEQDAFQERVVELKRFFAGFTVGGFALQRFGQFLERSVSEPLKNLFKDLYETTLAVDDFEQILRVRGGKTTEEIDAIYKAVLRVSNLPNLERPDVLQLFTRLTEATQGGLTANELERIGAGISKISTTLEAGEKRAFFGQLQDILGGGNVANIQKTLSLVPLLATTYNRLAQEAKASGKEINQTALITKALGELADLPNVQNLATKIKAIRNEIFEFSRRIGALYKQDLIVLVDFVTTHVIPAFDKLLIQFEKMSPAIHFIALAIAALGIVLPPVISAIGAFTIAFGGIGFAIEGIQGAFGALGTLLGTGGTLASVGTFLAKIPSLLTPIGAAVAVIVALLEHAFNENAGGFRDSIAVLATTILPALGTVLKSILDTSTALIAVLTNFYNLIDVAGSLTVTIGAIGTALAYILTISISFVNVIAIIPATLQFIADILSGDIELAFNRFYLTVLKILQAIGKVFGYDFTKEIAEVTKEVARLDGSTRAMYDANVAGSEKSLEQQKALEKAYKETQKTIEIITEAIKDQSKAIEQNTFKAIENAREKIRGIQSEQSARDASFYGDVAGEFDITSPEGQQGARDVLAKETAILESEAKQKTDARTQKEFRDALIARRDKILDLAEKELNEDTKEFYKKFAELYRAAIESPGGLSPEVLNKTVFAALTKELVGRFKFDSPQLNAIKQSIANERVLLDQVYKQSNTNLDIIIDAQSKNAEKRRQLDAKIKAAEDKRLEQEAEDKRLKPLLDEASTYSGLTKDAEDTLKNLTKEKQNIVSIGQLRNDVATALDTLQKYQKLYYEAQIAIIDNSIGTYGEKLDKKRQAYKDFIKAQQDAGIEANQLIDDFVREVVNDKTSNSQRFRKLLTTFGDEIKGQIDLTISAASGGITPDFAALKASSEAFNKIINDTASSLAGDSLKALSTAGKTLKEVGADFKPSDLKSVFDFIDKIGSLKGKYIDQAEVDKLLIESEGIVNILKTLAGATDPTKKDQIANINLAIDNLIRGIEGLRAVKTTYKDIIDIHESELKVDAALLDSQKRVNETVKDQLELEEQILELRQERLKDDSLPLFSKIYAAITGAEDKLAQARIKILENQKKTAELQLKIDLDRLEIAELILEKQLKGAFPGQKGEDLAAKAHATYEDEIKQVRRKGQLEQELLDEQIKTIRDNVSGKGGILDVFTDAFRKLLGKKKETRKTGTIDEHGNVIVNGNEPDAIDPDAVNAGQLPPSISDDATDATDKNATKQAKAIQRITGLIKGLGGAILDLSDLSKKGILSAVAVELQALAGKATVKALEYTAEAISAAVFGNYGKAAKAAAAAAAWTGVAVAANATARFLSNKAGTSASNAQASASGASGVPSGNYNPNADPTILKQKADQILIQLDIRTDDGIIIKKNIKALNENTNLSNLVLNSSDGWAFAPAP